MTRLVNRPLLYSGPIAHAVVDGAGVGMPAGHLPPFHFHVSYAPQPITGRLEPLVTQEVRIDRGYRCIAVSMEHDQWNGPGRLWRVPVCPLAHRCERGGEIVCGTIGKAGVHAGGGVQVRVS